MSENTHYDKVCTAVIVPKGRSVLLGKITSSGVGNGTWTFPIGIREDHQRGLRFLARKTNEETGLYIEFPFFCFAGYTFDDFGNGLRLMTLYYNARIVSGNLGNGTRNISEWRFFTWEGFPQPLFAPVKNFMKKYRSAID